MVRGGEGKPKQDNSVGKPEHELRPIVDRCLSEGDRAFAATREGGVPILPLFGTPLTLSRCRPRGWK